MAKKTTIQKYGYEYYKKEIRLRENIDEDLEPYDVVLPDPPFYKDFINYGLPKEEQLFKYEEKPKWLTKLNKLPREEAISIAESNPEYGAWIESQWEKRRNGVFMYIYGKPLWISGKYWFFLNYNPLQGEQPEFRYPDLEEAYWWDLCVEQNPLSFGGIVIAMRRDGKSAKAGALQLEAVTRIPYAVSGILSKNGNDAIEFFEKNVVKAWRKLPFFFAPKFDNKTYPKKELILRSASKGGEDLDSSDLIIAEGEVEDLDSRIEARTTKETSFDGEKLGGRDQNDTCIGLVVDEAGKWEDVDVYSTVMIHRECLRVRLVKCGKMYVTSTVEQMTPKGLIKFKKLCDDSSRVPEREKINGLGETVTGLSVFFKPAWETFIYDKWGFPIINTPTEEQSDYLKKLYISQGYKVYVDLGYHKMGAKEMLEKQLEAIEDPADKQAHMSRYPPSMKVAFTSVNKLCPFNSIDIIQKSLMRFRHGNPYIERFNIEVDHDSPLEIKPRKIIRTEAGKFEAKRGLLDFIEQHRANNVSVNDQGFLIPQNEANGIISSDPFKYNKVEGKRKSNGTLTAFFNLDMLCEAGKEYTADWLTEDWGIHYCFRPRTVDEYCDDAINLCHLLGMPIMCENNVDNVRQEFYRRGYAKFLKFRTVITEKNGAVVAKKASQPGVQMTGGAEAEAVMGSVDSHLSKHGMRCAFPSILEDCRDLDPDDWSDYDSFVTAGRSCYYSKMVIRAKKQETKKKKPIKDLVPLARPIPTVK